MFFRFNCSTLDINVPYKQLSEKYLENPLDVQISKYLLEIHNYFVCFWNRQAQYKEFIVSVILILFIST